MLAATFSFIFFFWGGWDPGGRVEDNPPGTRVRVSGLNHDVMEDDIKELFSGVGDLLHCEVRRDMAGLGSDLNMESQGCTSWTIFGQ